MLFSAGIISFFAALTPLTELAPVLLWWLVFGLGCGGGMLYYAGTLINSEPGIRKNRTMHSGLTSRGTAGWILAVFLTVFYIVFYWYPAVIGNLVQTTDWISRLLRQKPGDRWFLYGTLYTAAVLVMGFRMIVLNRHNRYQVLRSLSVMFFQLVLAYLVPAFLVMLNKPEFYFSYFWPLKYDYLMPGTVTNFNSAGGFGRLLVLCTILTSFAVMPVLTYLYGKRWYCSWVCGCGGLAETLGDPWRHLSDKSLTSWKIERWMIHSVLLVISLGTVLLWVDFFTNGHVLWSGSNLFKQWYGFSIGAVFSGVVGVGFYPLMGSRVWCRFGCPLAAGMGIIQKYCSRFRITTNGSQCMSCGTCSTYCEMGINVRWYAQRGQNIVRASCVGCGVCAEVCPRGVLKLENGAVRKRA